MAHSSTGADVLGHGTSSRVRCRVYPGWPGGALGVLLYMMGQGQFIRWARAGPPYQYNGVQINNISLKSKKQRRFGRRVEENGRTLNSVLLAFRPKGAPRTLKYPNNKGKVSTDGSDEDLVSP